MKWGIPQLLAMWRRSVLFTVGAISLGAEELETRLGRLLKKKGDGSERAARVKVPVRTAARTASGSMHARRNVAARARAVRKATVKSPKASVRTVRKVKASAPVALTANKNATL